MQLDARELAEFYETSMGQVARRTIMRHVRMLWPDLSGARVLGYGFATPYLKPFQSEAERVVAVMPAQQGIVSWPEGKRLAALSDEDALPFPDAMFDRILIVHGLEGAEAIRPLMRQLWRVLSAEGRILIVAPNRTSLWAQLERSPFGQGRPFHRGELDRILRNAMFEPERWDCTLHHPPLNGRRLIRTGATWESIGRRLWPALGGVHLIEAKKSLYAPAPVTKKKFTEPVLARA
ncbi:MAG: methyltransferase domain-containing protein [Rhizomicrobium sp.]